MLIGLSGYAQSGKDTFAEKMRARYRFRPVSFAAPIYEMAYGLDPIIGMIRTPTGYDYVRLGELVDQVGWHLAKQNPEVRRTLQRLGTEGGRNVFGQDFWVGYLLNDYDGVENLVVTDVRFRNEADAIHDMGGVVVRVHRNGVEAPNDHRSEHDLHNYPFEFVVMNNGTIDDLGEWADVLYSYCEKKEAA